METIQPERNSAQEYAFAIRELAEKFAGARGKAITLELMDKKFIRDVHIDPAAIAMGNLRVDSRPQPIASKSKFHIWRTYDLEHPPIAANDVAELAILAELLLRLEPYFSEKE